MRPRTTPRSTSATCPRASSRSAPPAPTRTPSCRTTRASSRASRTPWLRWIARSGCRRGARAMAFEA
eukprot:805156-Alexandrium_andersonii.AAC.1